MKLFQVAELIGEMTGSVEVLVILPEDLVRDAREYNLLTDETIAQLLREAVDKQVNELVNEEIRLYRAEKPAR